MEVGNKMVSATASSMTDFISSFTREEFTYSDFFLKEINDLGDTSFIFNDSSILDQYRGELKDLLSRVELSAEEYYKYRFNPKKLSHDLYGTTELWFLILDANELYTTSQFDLEVVYLYSTKIYSVLSKILNLEQEATDYNAEDIDSRS